MSQRFANHGLRASFARKKTVIAMLSLAATAPAWALSDFNDSSTGVSCQYWDKASSAAWKNTGGDWVDASGAAQGSNAFRTGYISDTNTGKQVPLDVSTLVKNWGNASVYRGIVLRNVGGANSVVFSSREGSAPPKLLIKYADGSSATLTALADSQLQCPWYTPIGTSTSMTLDKVQNVVLRFDAQRRTDVVGATLTLTSTAQYGDTSIGAFQLVQPGATTTASTPTGTTSTSTGTTSTSTGTTSTNTGTTSTSTGTTSTSTGTTTTSTGTTTATTTTATTTTAAATAAEPPAWYRLYDGSTGVTCAAWNLGAKLAWRNRGGDWLDASGAAQGTSAFAKAAVSGSGQPFTFDVTRLVQGWASPTRYRGILLKGESSGTVYLSSREGSAAPVLTVRYTDGTTATVKPNADSHLDCSTTYAKGQSTTLTVSSGMKAALSFDIPRRSDVASATLKVTTASSSGSATVGAYQLRQPETGATVPVQQGLAAAYPGDVGIENDPSVVMVERFEQSNFYQASKWGYSSMPSVWTAETISSDSTNGFQNLSGNAYRIRIGQGANYGTAIEAKTKNFMGSNPQEIYFRYNLRFASIFRDTSDGGKMPGVAGNTDYCGFGGRKCDGTDGWSLRGSFFNATDPSNPVYPRVLLGTYAYHADMATTYGDHWPWQMNGLGLVEQNRWYSVEQYVKMNTPGYKNGIIRVWIDGKLAFEKTDLNLSTVSGWPIEKIMVNHWYGGTGLAPHNLAWYMDNLVVAKKYIGPMKK